MAASNATLFAIGKSGRQYSVDVYIPDATGTNMTFNPSGLAGTGSQAYWRAPEALTIVDFSLGAAAPTAVGATFLADSAVINGATIRHANQLSTLNNRPKLAINVAAGALLGALQH
jgi:hypothetical protein